MPHTIARMMQYVVSKDSLPRPRSQPGVPVLQTYVQRAWARGSHSDVANILFVREETIAVMVEAACRHTNARSATRLRSKRNGHIAVESRGVIVEPNNARTTGSDVLPAHANGGLTLGEPAGFPVGTEAECLFKRFV